MSDKTAQVEQEMEPEQASELAALEKMAATDAQTDEGQGTEQEAQPVALAAEISGLLAMMVGMAAPIFPSLAVIYTPETVERVGAALEPVCVKRGWLKGGIGGEYSEELLAFCIVAPLAFATYKGIQGDIAASKPAKQIENAPTMPLGQQTGTTPDVGGKAKGLQIGEVLPHENS